MSPAPTNVAEVAELDVDVDVDVDVGEVPES
jgi:hypothetical protein